MTSLPTHVTPINDVSDYKPRLSQLSSESTAQTCPDRGEEQWQELERGRRLLDQRHLARVKFWERFTGENRKNIPGVWMSFKATVFSSWLNVFLVLIPIAWVSHFMDSWNKDATFALCFLAMIPLIGLFEFGGEQMAIYCGKVVGDLIIVTLNNAVEAALAIILLTKCELKLLQSTVSGVILLHLLLIPGVSFLAGGAEIVQQSLDPHATQLNQSLLTIGILTLLVPTALFAALDPGVGSPDETIFLNDKFRGDILRFSRGLAVLLLIIYAASRVFLLDPPGKGNALSIDADSDAPTELQELESELAHETPLVNPWFCVTFLIITVAVMSATAEFLVDSIDFVQENSHITKEWFGVVLLPLVSFSGDGVVAIIFFLKKALLFKPERPTSLAKAEAIDMSIQFTLFWLPVLVLLGWWIDKPFHLLFDLYEVALLVGACFLVNSVTADSKTNWAEGLILLSFYIMIALVTWYYDGQPQLRQLLQCESVAAVLNGGTLE